MFYIFPNNNRPDGGLFITFMVQAILCWGAENLINIHNSLEMII